MIVFKDIITCKHVTIFSQSSKDGNDAKNQKETRRRNTITIYLCQKYNISKVLIFLREKKKKKESTIKRPFERISSLSLYYSPRILIKIELKFRGLEFFEFLIKI